MNNSFFKRHGLLTGLGIIRRYFLYQFYEYFWIKKWFKVNGYKLRLNFDTKTIANGLYIMGSREKLETWIVKNNLDVGDICLDVGANIGYYSLLMAKQGHIVHAFEPDKRNIKILNENLRKNIIYNVLIHEKAISDKKGKDKMYLSTETNVNSLIKHEKYSGKDIEVKTDTIDNFAEKEYFDFIRMDVEGSEIEVLKGMRNLIESERPLKIMIEFHKDKYSKDRDITKKLINLKNNGFKLKWVVTQEKPQIKEFKEKGYSPKKIVNDSPNTRALYKDVDIEDLCSIMDENKKDIIRAGFFQR